ncbi:MAG: nucleotidyltransferase family protein [Opitutaceae bacterium]|nr:nucleotidyltransferase family protein [Opitutaceae bacterium]
MPRKDKLSWSAKRQLASPMSIANCDRMNVTDLPIAIDRERLAAFCRARGIRKLSVFGSVLRDDFDPGRSDVDVLVEMDPTARTGFRFFGYGDELAEIIGRKVDLNTPAMLSRYFRDEVLREALPLYEQTRS